MAPKLGAHPRERSPGLGTLLGLEHIPFCAGRSRLSPDLSAAAAGWDAARRGG